MAIAEFFALLKIYIKLHHAISKRSSSTSCSCSVVSIRCCCYLYSALSETENLIFDQFKWPFQSCIFVGGCGIRPFGTRIVGGSSARHGDWPWQAMLRTSSGFPYCGGTLVAPQWVVTATHCVQGKSGGSVFVR